MKRLEEKGVIFARLEDLEGVESYTAVYNGEVLVQGGSAADLRKSLDGAWAKTGDDLVRELDEMYLQGRSRRRNKNLKRKEEVAKFKHREFATKLSRSELNKIQEHLKELNVDLVIVDPYGDTKVKGYFTNDGKQRILPETASAMALVESYGSAIVLRKEATHYEFFHEYMHIRHSKEIGLEEYRDLRTLRYDVGRLIKEQWVYDKIIEYKAFFNQIELKHSLLYINKVRYQPHGKSPLKFDFDINTIPQTVENLNIEELLSKK